VDTQSKGKTKGNVRENVGANLSGGKEKILEKATVSYQTRGGGGGAGNWIEKWRKARRAGVACKLFIDCKDGRKMGDAH